MVNTWIVVPAFNEAEIIVDVISDLKDKGYTNIVVIDDGSSDSTSSAASKAGAITLKHKINQGQGAALRTGINYCLSKGAELIVTFDADGQHSVKDIPRMIAPVVSGNYDISLGSRFLRQGSNVPIIRSILLQGGAFMFLIFYGVKLTDSHNGFRVMSRHAAKSIRITCDRMEHASEIIEKIGKYKLKYKEIPVTIKYTSYSKSKGQGNLCAFKFLFNMLSRKLSRK